MHTGFPFPALFVPSLVLGTLLSLSSTNWIMMWAGLELNLISFIPLLLLDKKTHHTEVTIKYFTVQAIGSIMVLFSYNKILPFMLLGLLLKMGAAPLHFWFVSMIKRLPWATMIILMTWQKVAPLALLSSCVVSTYECIFIYIGAFNAWLGGLYSIYQTDPKKLLAYSSVANLGWMIALLPSKPMLLLFFILYCATLAPLVVALFQNNSATPQFSKMTALHKLMISVLLISLASIPPTPGFLMKWMTLPILMGQSSLPIPPLALLMSAIPLAYAYLTLMFNMWLAPPKGKMTTSTCLSFSFPLFVITAFVFCSPIAQELPMWMYNES